VAVAEQRRKKRVFTFRRVFTSAVGFEQKAAAAVFIGANGSGGTDFDCSCVHVHLYCIFYITLGSGKAVLFVRRVGSTLHPRPSITPRRPPSTLLLFAGISDTFGHDRF